MKVALVTAGSGGIGKAIVDLFLEQGYHVAVTGRNMEKLQLVFNSYSSSHIHLIENTYVTDNIGAQNVIEEVIKRFGQLDVLVNNVGGATLNQRMEDADYSVFNDAFLLNVNSVFCMTQPAIPYLTETRGSIINMSSVLGSRPAEGLGAYSASKAAVEMLTKTTALELAPKKVRVNCVAPTATQTEFHVNAGMTEEQADTYYKKCASTHPLGRVCQAEDVAKAVLFLAETNFVTGTVLPVDGGRLLTSKTAFTN